MTKPRRALFGVIIFAVVIQLIYSFVFRVPPAVDARTYDQIGQHLAQGLGYRMNTEGELALDPAIGRVGPGYPFVLAALYRVFGHHLEAVWVLQALCVGLSVYCVYLLAKRVLPTHPKRELGALVAASAIALSPDLITIGSMVLTETISITLSLVWLVLLTSFIPQNQSRGWKFIWRLVGLGLIAAGCILVRTTAVLLLVPTVALLGYRRRILEIGVVVGLVVLLFIPWTVRNQQVYHRFLPTNTALGVNLIGGNYPGASGEFEGLPAFVEQPAAAIQDPIAQNAYLTREAERFILQHPLEYTKLCLKRAVIAVSAMRPSAFWFHLTKREQLITAGLSVLHLLTLFIFGISGIITACKRWRVDRSEELQHFMLGFALLVALIPPIFIVAESRYRFFLYPILAIYGVYGILAGNPRVKKQFIWVALGYGLICAIDLASKLSVVLSRLS